jgi:hypothetical protein
MATLGQWPIRLRLQTTLGHLMEPAPTVFDTLVAVIKLRLRMQCDAFHSRVGVFASGATDSKSTVATDNNILMRFNIGT